MSRFLLVSCGAVMLAVALQYVAAPAAEAPTSQARDDVASAPAVVRDLLWVWGFAGKAHDGQASAATFASASPAQRAALLGIDNIVMAGQGLPDDHGQADEMTARVATANRLVWETRPDGAGIGPPFLYQQRMAQIRKLVDRYPRIEGVLLDDMSTGKIDRGFKPEHIRHIRSLLPGKYGSVKVWGVVYTMSLGRAGMDDYLRELDVINLWAWHAKDVVKLEKYVAHCRKVAPDKPIVLGLYLHDYGGGRSIPPELLSQQCDTALKLAHAGQIQGMLFLTEDNAPDAVEWTIDWIKRVGDQKLSVAARR